MNYGYELTTHMLARVARALGSDLLEETVFVGGCTTGLLLTDEAAQEDVRHTKDVDVIVDVIGPYGWNEFKDKVRDRGFKERMDMEVPTCAFFLDDLRVDFMPDDASILGYSNRWYRYALDHADRHTVEVGEEQFLIRVVSALSFVATKLEAFLGRGKGDVASHDLEDILLLFFGRETLVDEIQQGPPDITEYIAREISKLLAHEQFEWVVLSAAHGDPKQEDYIFERLERVANCFPGP